MWAAQYREHGGPDVLAIEEVPVPRLRQGQVLVRVTASCVSRIDAEFRRGRLPHGIGFPKQVGFDALGEVVDANGTDLPVGAWVLVVLGLEPFTRRGTTVELLAVEPARCGAFPDGHAPSPDECALALGGLTALRAIRDSLRTSRGDRVLVVGAGGPVGMAAVQIAQLHGARVDAVAGEAALDICSRLGAGEVWDYRADVAEMQASRRYDGIVVAAGNPSEWLTAARRGGRAVLTDASTWPRSLSASLRHRVRSAPVAAGHSSQDLAWLADRIAAGELTAVVGRRYAYAGIAQAHAELGSTNTAGARLIEHEVAG